jgi:aurora kinase, other
MYGKVYVAREKKTKDIFALKVITKKYFQRTNSVFFLRREIEIQSHLHHPNIISLYGYFCDDDRVYMALEYAPNGDRFEMKQWPSETTAAKWTYQLADALEYIHQKGIMHRDIKRENLLIVQYGEVKYTDFGQAVQCVSTRRTTAVGPKEYQAPELARINKKYGYDKAVDIRALGVSYLRASPSCHSL